MIRVIAETDRHAGHANIIRELIDGGIGLSAGRADLPPADENWWFCFYRARLEEAARAAGAATDETSPR